MRRNAAVVIALTLAATHLLAQAATTASRTPTAVRDSLTLDEMKAALRGLVAAEENIYADHDTYTTSIAALDRYLVYHGQVQTEVTFASRRAWTAVATEPSLKGKSCVVYVGSEKELPDGFPRTMAGGITAKDDGVPTCDKP